MRGRPKMHRRLCFFLIIAAALGSFSQTANATDAARGKLIYETNCNECHGKSVSERPNKKAKSISDIRHWVLRWESYKGYQWTNEEIEDVTQYLNSRFYKY